MTINYTKQDLELIKQYEIRNDTKIGDREYRKNLFQEFNNDKLTQAYNGVSNAIYNRTNLDNSDSFDSPDDTWKLKVLQENLGVLEKLIKNGNK